jgi:uncharacterized protein YyaL (SSP411 family)
MLALQGELIALYARAAEKRKQPKYRAAAERAAAYVQRTLFDEKTGDLWASQDADESYFNGERKRPPYVDKTLLADRAARMVEAWCVLGDRARAKKAADRLLQLQQPDGLFRHGVGLRAYLSDQAYTARALSCLNEAAYTSAAKRALIAAQQKWTAPSGALYDGDLVEEGRLSRRDQPLAENAVFAQALGGPAAKKILEAFAGDIFKYGTEAASWALAIGR